MRVLLVEDDPTTSKSIEMMLTHANLNVYSTDMGEDGVDLAKLYDYDLILLDLNLPDMTGHEVLRQIRLARITTPILILSGLDDTDSKIRGFGFGADDYLTKPFAFSELLARIRVLLRRGKAEVQTTLKIADLTLNLVSHKVKRENQEIELTGKEYSLLEYFLRNQGKVLTRTMIAEHVWDYNFDTFTNVIDVYVNHLRKKIDKNYSRKLLHTLRGVGYIMKE